MSPLLGTGLPYGLHISRKGHNAPRGSSAGWWVLTIANAAGGTNGQGRGHVDGTGSRIAMEIKFGSPLKATRASGAHKFSMSEWNVESRWTWYE
jgi:hypothetical protein